MTVSPHARRNYVQRAQGDWVEPGLNLEGAFFLSGGYPPDFTEREDGISYTVVAGDSRDPGIYPDPVGDTSWRVLVLSHDSSTIGTPFVTENVMQVSSTGEGWPWQQDPVGTMPLTIGPGCDLAVARFDVFFGATSAELDASTRMDPDNTGDDTMFPFLTPGTDLQTWDYFDGGRVQKWSWRLNPAYSYGVFPVLGSVFGGANRFDFISLTDTIFINYTIKIETYTGLSGALG